MLDVAPFAASQIDVLPTPLPVAGSDRNALLARDVLVAAEHVDILTGHGPNIPRGCRAIVLNCSAHGYRGTLRLDGLAQELLFESGDVVVAPRLKSTRCVWTRNAVFSFVQLAPDNLIAFAQAHAGILLDDVHVDAHPQFRDPMLCRMGRELIRCETDIRDVVLHRFLLRLVWNLARRRMEDALQEGEAVAHGSLSPVDLPSLSTAVMQDRRLLRVVEHVEAHIDEPLDIDALADVAHISRYHFGKIFHQAVGQTPHRYVMTRRVAHARTLLRTSDAHLSAIAFACGFSSHSHLTRFFKQAMGVTPSEFRRTAL